MLISIFDILRGNIKRAYYFRKEEYEEVDINGQEIEPEKKKKNKSKK